MKLGLREPMPGKRVWAVRVDPLSMKQIEVECPDGVTWTSRKNVLELRPLVDAAVPDESATRRLIQAKDIARRFSVSTETPNLAGRRQFRLMPHPIDRYSDPEAGLLDGLFFNFAFTNNPSMLLVLEAIADGNKERTWRFAIVRQGRDRRCVDRSVRRETRLERSARASAAPVGLIPQATDACACRGSRVTEAY